jgi:hypothetical protein
MEARLASLRKAVKLQRAMPAMARFREPPPLIHAG